MKEVIAIVRPDKTVETRKVLKDIGIRDYTTMPVLGRGRGGGVGVPRMANEATRNRRFIPERLFWIVVEDEALQLVLESLRKVNRTGRRGVGTIFVLPREGMIAVEKTGFDETGRDDDLT